MNIPLSLPGFEGRRASLQTASFFSGAKLLENGVAVPGKKGVFRLKSNSGTEVVVRFKRRFLDPVPDVEVGGRTITIMESLRWYEYLWMGIPIVLVFTGGAIGGLFGGAAVLGSSHVFRSSQSTPSKYALTGLISVASVVGYVVIAGTLMAVMHK